MGVVVENFNIKPNVIKIGKTQGIKGDIVFYGDDNKYPQLLENLIDNSETAVLCVKTKAKFLATEFEDSNIGSTVIGNTSFGKKYTLRSFIRDMSYSIAKFGGAYMLVIKNLEGKVVNAKVLDFPKVRFSQFDDLGNSNYAYVGDFNKEIVGKKGKINNFQKYPLFTSNVDIFKEMSENTGTTASIYHVFTEDRYFYPTNPFESVVHDMDTEKNIQISRNNELTNYSPNKLIIRTDFSKDERKRMEQIEQIKNFIGPKGDKLLVIKSSFDESGEPVNNGYSVDTIENTLQLDEFEIGENACEKNIRKAIQIPSILISPNDGATVDTSAVQLIAAVDYFNNIVSDERKLITEALNEIFANTIINFGSKNFKLKDFEIKLTNNEVTSNE